MCVRARWRAKGEGDGWVGDLVILLAESRVHQNSSIVVLYFSGFAIFCHDRAIDPELLL